MKDSEKSEIVTRQMVVEQGTPPRTSSLSAEMGLGICSDLVNSSLTAASALQLPGRGGNAGMYSSTTSLYGSNGGRSLYDSFSSRAEYESGSSKTQLGTNKDGSFVITMRIKMLAQLQLAPQDLRVTTTGWLCSGILATISVYVSHNHDTTWKLIIFAGRIVNINVTQHRTKPSYFRNIEVGALCLISSIESLSQSRRLIYWEITEASSQMLPSSQKILLSFNLALESVASAYATLDNY